MEIKDLSTVDFGELMDCFLTSFEHYFVKMPTDHNFYKERWRIANVKYEMSYGMFDQDKLVGFIINAVDVRNGNLIAFNTGTGVLPSYRGQQIVKRLYEYAIPELKKQGVNKCKLEVIKENRIAIKAYERIGFKIIKNYKCYRGNIKSLETCTDFELKQVKASYFDWSCIDQDLYSWDNHIDAINRGKFSYFVIVLNGKLDAYFIIHPDNGYIAQFNIFNADPKSWIRLFNGIKRISESIKINNIEEHQLHKIQGLKSIGLQNTVDQFEMEMEISK